jgi:error-prone DNA polymerase
MPELPHKIRPHPARAARGEAICAAPADVPYAELAVTSNFTFLTGASHPEELVARAAELGYAAVAVADTNTLAGIVRAHVAAREHGIGFAVGCRLALADPPGLEVLVYPTDLSAYGRLCELLTLGKRRAAKGQCRLVLHDLLENSAGLLAVIVPPESLDQRFVEVLQGLSATFDDDRLSILARQLYGPDEQSDLARLVALSKHVRIPLMASNDALYHVPQRRRLQDVLTCIRHGCSLAEAGYRLHANAERHLKASREMARLMADCPRAVRRAVEVARRAAAFSLDELRYQYPDEICPPARSPIEHLADLTWAGAGERYPQGVSDRVREQILHELKLIDELNYAPYFLTVHDLVVFARSRGILCQGRGAAANSAVCFALGVTAVDPERIEVLFERFISRERNEPPDIDIDFEHERREEVIQYIYSKYGRDRAALTAEVISYRPRSAVRDIGKVLGLSLDAVDRLAKTLDFWGADEISDENLTQAGLRPDDPTVQRLRELAHEMMGFPRHLSQHVGGFVITRTPLSRLVPIENAAMPDRTVIEWDKDDIDAMGMLKVDCLGLGMLTCIRKCFEMIARRHGRPLSLATIPPEDPAVYDRICQADTVGVFQIESRAQMSMLPRLRPRCFYDLVIEVAIVRPGPIVGDMVHPYLRRRNGQEPVEYPDDAIKQVLGKTLGVPLFQEQAMRLAIVAAGFTPGQADKLRRAIGSKRSREQVLDFGRRLIEGMTARGYSLEFATRVFKQIQGFSSYGFPESHAASFALLVYASAWLKRYYPATFAACLLNSQPMGFYAPAQIVRDAREHGVTVLPVDVNYSGWDCRLEVARRPRGREMCVRLGMRLVKSLRRADAMAIERAVAGHGPFADVHALRSASGAAVASLRALAQADAMGSMGITRQAALWQIRAMRDDGPLLAGDGPDLLEALPVIPEFDKVMKDYSVTGLSLRKHPMAFLRDSLRARQVAATSQVRDPAKQPHGSYVKVAGVVLVRQRPSSAAGVIFITLEDETGSANVMIRPSVLPRLKKAAMHAGVLMASGRVERNGSVVHVLVEELDDITDELRALSVQSRNFH